VSSLAKYQKYHNVVQWKVYIKSLSAQSYKVVVEGLDSQEEDIVRYYVTLYQFDGFTNGYRAQIEHHGKNYRFDVLFQASSGTTLYSYDILIVQRKVSVAQYVIVLEKWGTSTTAYRSTHTTLSSISVTFQTILQKYIEYRTKIVTTQESIVAVQGLLKWIFSADLTKVTVQKIAETSSGYLIQITEKKKAFTLEVVTINYENQGGMY
jgi:hypothetical protein